ncbi:MAG TPA: biotin/lipoate--protein ligase family protein [Ferrovibrio sp.]|uniref:biotin/lipoate--protein ligase family protein n=1 Tax=Ferrovibrio sp. TaxID=1917215 RepID=UPI002B4ABB13|nr:biotin/lipoate--protein ligase family protein [Ferrovibrio sp.]HLT78630.1 biotin/lipoate--protein ligase family protein [Ferrovibrio sp.]
MRSENWPSFPPGYEARLCASDAFDTACRAAEDGADDGLLLWVDRPDRCEAAVVLHPLDPIDAALTLSYVGLLGLHDALAAVAPPETPASMAWPDRLMVNDACVGGIRIAHGPLVEKEGMSDVPAWLVIGIAVQMSGDPEDDAPGAELEYTNLLEEGCGEVTVPMLVESFSRHLLQWLDRWQEEGFHPVRRAFLHDRHNRDLNVEPNGDVWFQDGPAKSWRSLREALRRPSWVLPEYTGPVS